MNKKYIMENNQIYAKIIFQYNKGIFHERNNQFFQIKYRSVLKIKK